MSSNVLALKELIKDEHQKRIDNNERDYSYFHASEFYKCIRQIAYKYYGAKEKSNIKPDLQRIFDNGDYMHSRYGKYFENLGILYGIWKCKNPLCSKKYGESEKYGILKPDMPCEKCGCHDYLYEEMKVKNDEYMIGGHVDGILKLFGNFHVIDYKSMNSNFYSRLKEPLDKHIIQVEIYLWLLELESGFLLYENKDTQKIKIYEVKYNQELVNKITNRLLALKKIVENKKLPKRPYENNSKSCKACEFHTTCWK